MNSRARWIIGVLGCFILLGMIAGYILLLPDDDGSPVAAARAADYDSALDGDHDDSDTHHDKHRDGRGHGDGLGASGQNGAAGATDSEDPNATTEATNAKKDPNDTSDIDPAEINRPIPGWYLVRLIDGETERPLPGAMVYFPMIKPNLRSEMGDVKITPEIAHLKKRANKFGVAAWHQRELVKLLGKDAIPAPPKKGKKPKTSKADTSVLATYPGYVDVFEPLRLPPIAKGAEKVLKMYEGVRVLVKVREKRGGAIRNPTINVLQTSDTDAKTAKPRNSISVEGDALGEAMIRVAKAYKYIFEVKHHGFAKYRTQRVFDFSRDEHEVCILLEAARGISGTVTDTSGKPIEKAEVFARNDGEKVVTDAKGQFEFDMVKDRIYTNDVQLRVSADGYAPQTVKVLANDRNIKIKLEPEGSLHGVVVDEKGDPVPGANVRCVYLEGRNRIPLGNAQTDNEGKFDFGGFGKGRVVLDARSGDLVSPSQAIDVKPKADKGPVTLRLSFGATIIGRVVADGVGLAGVPIYLDGEPATETDAMGNYRIEGLSDGKHKVKIVNEYPITDEQLRQLSLFTVDGESFYYLPGTVERKLKLGGQQEINFDVQNFEVTANRDVTLRIVTEPREPVSGLTMVLDPVFGEPPSGIEKPKKITLDLDLQDGTLDYPVTLIDGVEYEASFDHIRYFPVKLSRSALVGVRDGGVIEVKLERAFVIKGYVRDSDGNGIEGVGLSNDPNNPWNMKERTDIHGYFEFGQLREGDHKIYAFKTSYYREERTVNISGSDPDEVNIVMVSANEIRIIVTNNATPQPGAHVHIYRNDAEGDKPDDYKRHFDIGTTDANGEKYIDFHWIRNYQIVAFYGNEVAFVNFNNLREVPEREFTIELEAAYDLKGSLRDQETGKPLTGVIVRAHLDSTGVEGRDGNLFQTTTDAQGNFSFRIPSGSYWFYVPKTSSHQSVNTEGQSHSSGSTGIVIDVPLRDDIEGNYAVITSMSVPATMIAGQQYDVEVTVRNAGGTTWTSAGNKPWRLGSMSKRDNKRWGMSRVNIPAGTEVRPKETYTFRFKVTAPVNAGAHKMQWQMVQDGKEWFGMASNIETITVTTE